MHDLTDVVERLLKGTRVCMAAVASNADVFHRYLVLVVMVSLMFVFHRYGLVVPCPCCHVISH